MKINCLIVDDEQLARQLLESYVLKIPHMELIKSCKSAVEAIEFLQKGNVDLMFLDIQMPDLSGIEFLQTLKNKPLVIFTTAYKEFALDGYELDVIDYMLKPISFERFLQGSNKALEQIKLIKAAKNKETPSKDFVSLKSNHKVYKVKYNDIYYIEGLKEYVTFYTKDKKIVVLESLKRLEKTLPQELFLRIHKSYVINIQIIDSMYGNQLEVKGNYLPIGKMYLDKVKRILFPDI
ncbi:MAG: LytTR family DNA-binding domain-containing protein [Bacteroidales bacterium]|nr:LytTR family DNA-binding domain-containing protein [Bacteroidales bacterium]